MHEPVSDAGCHSKIRLMGRNYVCDGAVSSFESKGSDVFVWQGHSELWSPIGSMRSTG